MIVEITGLAKRFPARRSWAEAAREPFQRPQVPAVQDVSFDVAEAEIFGLLGQNGAGKTTLFKMLATLIAPDAGTIRIAGHSIGDDDAAVRSLLAPVLANERSLYWRLSARENLRLYATLQGLSAAARTAEIERVLQITALTDTGAKMVGMFSSGMRQRLLIARALLARPRILLLDEPTRSLDPISARDFRTFLRETIVGAEGCTVLLATHDAEEVWELCDRVGVLERGRLLAVDRTATLRHRAGRAVYEIWLRTPDGPNAVTRLAGLGHTLQRVGAAAESGWDHFRCGIDGGADEAARVLAALTANGREVGRFERHAPSLADLIERVLADREESPVA